MPAAPHVIDDRPLSADRVPTLTEVVELDLPAKSPAAAEPFGEPELPGEGAVAEPAPALPPEELLADEIIAAAGDETADAGPTAMADDFLLAGLEADDAVEASVPAEAEAEVPVAAAASALADAPVGDAADADAGIGGVDAVAAVEGPAPRPVPDVDAVVGQVLSELLPRIDMLLESRLREALAPALARAADGLIRDTRVQLAVAVRELVQEAVDRALQRRADG